MKKCDNLSHKVKTVEKDVTLKLNAKFDIEREKFENKILKLRKY